MQVATMLLALLGLLLTLATTLADPAETMSLMPDLEDVVEDVDGPGRTLSAIKWFKHCHWRCKTKDKCNPKKCDKWGKCISKPVDCSKFETGCIKKAACVVIKGKAKCKAVEVKDCTEILQQTDKCVKKGVCITKGPDAGKCKAVKEVVCTTTNKCILKQECDPGTGHCETKKEKECKQPKAPACKKFSCKPSTGKCDDVEDIDCPDSGNLCKPYKCKKNGKCVIKPVKCKVKRWWFWRKRCFIKKCHKSDGSCRWKKIKGCKGKKGKKKGKHL